MPFVPGSPRVMICKETLAKGHSSISSIILRENDFPLALMGGGGTINTLSLYVMERTRT